MGMVSSNVWGGINMINKMENAFNNYCTLVDQMFNETESAVNEIAADLRLLHKRTLQTKLALDYLLAKEGGLCVLINDTACCSWFEDPGIQDMIGAHLQKIEKLKKQAIDLNTPEKGSNWNPFGNWNIGGWMGLLIQQISFFPSGNHCYWITCLFVFQVC